MLYTRTSSDDFDRYARVTNDSGWSWESLQPYIFKVRMQNLNVHPPYRLASFGGRTKTSLYPLTLRNLIPLCMGSAE